MKHISKLTFCIIIFVASLGSIFGQTNDDKSNTNSTIEDSAHTGFSISIITGRRNPRQIIPNLIPNIVPIVTNVILDKTIVFSTVLEKTSQIEVFTEAVDWDNDPLVFNYTVSAGKIIGAGSKVVWDLSNVTPGTYTITVEANDGCGICGEKITKQIRVVE